jgi:hypothetical protein
MGFAVVNIISSNESISQCCKAGYLIAAGGPPMVGALRDSTHSSRIPISLLVVAAVAMLALTPLLKPRDVETTRWSPAFFFYLYIYLRDHGIVDATRPAF